MDSKSVFGYLAIRMPFVQSWKKVWGIAFILALVLLLVMILLQPHGIYDFSSPNKFLIIAGFSLCVIIPMVFFHSFEEIIYKYQENNWFLHNEIGTVLSVSLVVSFLSYVYNEYTLNYNPDTNLGITGFVDFSIPILVPYLIFLIPLWIYLRYKWGQISDLDESNDKKIRVEGQNKDEYIEFTRSNFIYAESHRNYVQIYYFQDGDVEKGMIRNTLKNTVSQIPDAVRVHRSYLVNDRYISEIAGNVRNPFIAIEPIDIELPVSSEFYKEHR